MSGSSQLIKDVPTNLITGFLGVGKTTAILHLLRSKPEDQRWAVLVNEFGEIGVDGSLMQGQHGEDQGVFVTEVPGGCMCCAAGLPMQVALNQLLTIARPDRVLIEPTGLGHAKEVLQVLTRSASYQTALDVQRTITLVNARQLNDSRYTDNDIFNQQIEVADVIVGNKADLYHPDDQHNLHTYVQQNTPGNATIVLTTHGRIDPDILQGKAGYTGQQATEASPHHHTSTPQTNSIPACGYIKKLNKGNGFYSVGWRFREEMIFQHGPLFSLLSGIAAERVKAVMNTDQGVVGFNYAEGALTEIPLFGCGQSCLEIICETVDDSWEHQLLQCLADSPIG